MRALADYVHSKGLKFGMYTAAGNVTCEGYPASFGFESADARARTRGHAPPPGLVCSPRGRVG